MIEGKMSDLNFEIKKLIINVLELEDIRPEQIGDDDALFGSALGLDSIDALTLGVAIKEKFGINFPSDGEENRRHFTSVHTLASYINSQGGWSN
jgi:acyl carrier protein